MLNLLFSLLTLLRSSLRTRLALQLEIVALRHQLGILQSSSERKRPRFQNADRILWVWLSRLWSGWRQALVIIRPKTVVAWHRMGFRLYWRWKNRTGRPGRPAIQKEVRDLIRQMSQANPLWGAPRIHGELLKLGIDVCETTIAKYMVRATKPPSQTWRTFLTNHLTQMVSVDFFVVPTATFQLLFVFVVLAHERRRVVHFIVFNESGLRRILRSYFDYYHCSRTHLALAKDAPQPRTTQPPESGKVVALPILSGLHHRYERRAA